MTHLTPLMRATLEQAAKHELRRVHNPAKPGPPPWPAPPASLAAAVRRELLRHDRIRNKRGLTVDTWTITDTGREALQPQHRTRVAPLTYLAGTPGRVRFKQQDPKPGARLGRWTVDESTDGGDDYTNSRARSLFGAGEVLDPPDPRWAAQAQARHLSAQDPRARARQLRGARRAA